LSVEHVALRGRGVQPVAECLLQHKATNYRSLERLISGA
jgi:hypothetical protein